MGVVYQARNTVNGKCYIGKTMQSLGFRRSELAALKAEAPEKVTA